MTDQDYEYRGLLASTWDLFRGDTSNWEDKFFYEKIIQRYGQPVLDVGCGTGRLILDFLSQDVDIDGLDVSPEMLAICRRKAQSLGLSPNLYEQGMEVLALPRRYCTIIVPSLSFQLVVDTSSAVQAMNRFYEHLVNGGALVIPFRIFWEEGDPVELEWKLLGEETRPSDGAKIRHWAYALFDGEEQVQFTEDRYEIFLNDQVVKSEHHKRSPALRWYTQSQALALYQSAGFNNIRIYSGFEDKPASTTDNIFTIIGTK